MITKSEVGFGTGAPNNPCQICCKWTPSRFSKKRMTFNFQINVAFGSGGSRRCSETEKVPQNNMQLQLIWCWPNIDLKTSWCPPDMTDWVWRFYIYIYIEREKSRSSLRMYWKACHELLWGDLYGVSGRQPRLVQASWPWRSQLRRPVGCYYSDAAVALTYDIAGWCILVFLEPNPFTASRSKDQV